MKKIIFCIFCICLLTGCKNNSDKLGIILEQTEEYTISIHYPKTDVKKLEKNIKSYVNEQIRNFKKQTKKKSTQPKELNIDYTYYQTKNIKTVSITTYIHDGKTSKEETKCFTYNIKKRKYLTLKDFIEKLC